MRQVEDVLQPGEKILWEGRPIGYPRPSCRRALAYLGFFLILLWIPLLCIALTVSQVKKGMGKIQVTPLRLLVWGTTPAGQTVSFDMPGPVPFLGFFIAVLLWEELHRIGEYRSPRFGITDKRVIAMRWRNSYAWPFTRYKVEAVERGHTRSAEVRGRDLVVERDRGPPFVLEALADPEAARSALV
jgi:hypothetical protein